VKLGIQAARALEYAHQQGVVHRDVKPGNLLVDANREHLWITDFGLARCRGDSDLTRTGDLLGTLRYMSPEQALARPGMVDHRTDVYALGATLYELLTLHPVYPAESKQEMLRRIAEEEPIPLRRYVPDLHIDLQTIILQALARSPDERYPSAHALAQDLQRFLENRPIRARRPSPMDALLKWAKRRRRLVAGTVLTTLVILIAQTVSLFVIAAQRDEAGRLTATARSAVDDMYVGFVQQWLSERPLLESEQQALLLKALHFYEHLAGQSGQDPQALLGIAHAHHCVADIRARLGDRDGARQAYQTAIAILDPLVGGPSNLPGAEAELAGCWNDLGNVLRDLHSLPEAEAAYRDARRLYAQQAAADPDDSAAWDGLAGAGANLGVLLGKLARRQEAGALMAEAMQINRHWVEASSRAPSWRFNLAQSLGAQAALDAVWDDESRAEALYREAIEHWAALAREYPERVNYRHALIAGHCALAAMLQDKGSLAKAESSLQQALGSARKLVEYFPRVPAFQQIEASTQTLLSRVLRERAKLGEAETNLRQARSKLEAIAKASANPGPVWRELAACEFELGRTIETRDPEDAESLYRRAAEHVSVPADHPMAPEILWLSGRIDASLGALLVDARRAPEGRILLARGLSTTRRLAAEFPRVGKYQVELAWEILRSADQGRPAWDDAVLAARLATSLQRRDPAAWAALGGALFRSGQFREAVSALEKARRLGDSRTVAASYYLALSYQTLGSVEAARRAWSEAERMYASNPSPDRALARLRDEARQSIDRLSNVPAGPSLSKERTNG
jgi:tetratricopeptide (TPR) repeat protein